MCVCVCSFIPWHCTSLSLTFYTSLYGQQIRKDFFVGLQVKVYSMKENNKGHVYGSKICMEEGGNQTNKGEGLSNKHECPSWPNFL